MLKTLRFALIEIFKILRVIFNTLLMVTFKFIYINEDKLNPLPQVKSNYLLLPAHELAKKIREKEISSTKVVELYIDRIKEVQPLLNCVTATCFDEALERAKFIDNLLESKNELPETYSVENSPLLGVPFSCKENIWIKDKPNSSGLVCRRNKLAPQDSEVVKNMRDAGAILIAITNLSEICLFMESRNNLYGRTNNAYNLSRSAGGSSGGEAALIAAAGSLIGIGSDIGGSIRIPCCFNGIYGHKCSNGLITIDEKFPETVGEVKRFLNTVGPMCRYATDLRILLKIQANKEKFSKIEEKFNQKVDLSKLNYFVISDINDGKVTSLSKESRECLNLAVNFVENKLHVKVKPIYLDDFKDVYSMWASMMRNGQIRSNNLNKLISDSIKQEYNPFKEFIKSIFRKSDFTFYTILQSILEKLPMKEAENLSVKAFELKHKFDILLGENSVILTAGYPTVAPFHHQQIFYPFDFIYFGLYNVLGLPVTQCPISTCPKTGLPLGIQIATNDQCDHLSISLAEYFEENLGGWKAPFKKN